MGKEEKIECRNYIGISLLNVVGKIYARIFVDRVLTVTEGLSDDDKQIFTVKQKGNKAREKKIVYVGLMDLGRKACGSGGRLGDSMNVSMSSPKVFSQMVYIRPWIVGKYTR